MDGYLLDTNVVSVLANSRNLRHAEFKQKLGNLQHVWLPVVAIAEIESGMAKADRPMKRSAMKYGVSSGNIRSIWALVIIPLNLMRFCVVNYGECTQPAKNAVTRKNCRKNYLTR